MPAPAPLPANPEAIPARNSVGMPKTWIPGYSRMPTSTKGVLLMSGHITIRYILIQLSQYENGTLY